MQRSSTRGDPEKLEKTQDAVGVKLRDFAVPGRDTITVGQWRGSVYMDPRGDMPFITEIRVDPADTGQGFWGTTTLQANDTLRLDLFTASFSQHFEGGAAELRGCVHYEL